MSFALEVDRKKKDAQRTPMCKLGAYRLLLPQSEQDALDYAIDMCRKDADTAQPARVFTSAWLTKVFNDNGLPIGKTVVSSHLRKECSCEQTG